MIKKLPQSISDPFCVLLLVSRDVIDHIILFSRSANPNWRAAVEIHSRRIRLLRKLLRANPFWLKGHLALAFSETYILATSPTSREPRSFATVQSSVSAVKVLASNPGSRFENVLFKCELLQGMLFYFKKDYARAVEVLTRVFNDEERRNAMPQDDLYLALDHAGAAALVLDNNQLAKACFLAIPEDKRSLESRDALRMIDTPQ